MYETKIIEFIYVFKFFDLITDDDVSCFAKDIDNLFSKNEIFYIILDVKDIKNFNFSFFNKFDPIFEDEDKVRKYFKACVIITNNKKILKLILSIKKPLMSTNIDTNYESAIKYLKDIKKL